MGSKSRLCVRLYAVVIYLRHVPLLFFKLLRGFFQPLRHSNKAKYFDEFMLLHTLCGGHKYRMSSFLHQAQLLHSFDFRYSFTILTFIL